MYSVNCLNGNKKRQIRSIVQFYVLEQPGFAMSTEIASSESIIFGQNSNQRDLSLTFTKLEIAIIPI